MTAVIYSGSTKMGWVSTSGEVYYQEGKVGWVNHNGDIYLNGIPYGWVTCGGNVLDRRLIQVGHIDNSGNVYRGGQLVGRVNDPSTRYYTGGAALLLLLGRFNTESLVSPTQPALIGERVA